jgi:long-chain acyl-CoA synthetase
MGQRDPERRTLPHLLRQRSGRHGEAGFLRSRAARWTYAEFDHRSGEVAAGLAQLGVGRGDVVSMMLPNRPEYFEAWWGILKVGAVFNPVNPQLTGREAALIVADAGARVAICSAETAETLSSERDRVPELETIVDVDGGHVPIEGLRAHGALEDLPAIDEGDLAALVYTSGTTGRPKGAMLSHGNYLADTEMFAELVPAGRGDVLGMILPLFHVNAQVATTMLPILIGGEIAMWDRFSASTFWETVAELEPVTFSAVPTILAALLHAPGADAADTSSLRYVVCGAAPLSPALFEEFERKFGLTILEGYGLTEGTCVSTLNPYWGTRKIGSIGLPLRRQEVVVLDEEGGPVPDDELGEICVRGANVMQGYYGLPDATAETLRDGWLRTGDVGYRDAEGFLFLVDRKKDLIIRGGENIYPREVEDVLLEHPAVREAVVIGRPDEVRGEEVHAVVALVEGATADDEALGAHCAERLAPFKRPSTFEFRDDLPKTATGKLDKKPLREELASGAEVRP